MAKTTTISVRVPEGTRDWLERRTHKMGTAGSAAARILEESRRRESFRGVEFRDTPDGRIAIVSETRVPVHLFARSVRDQKGRLDEVASHCCWLLWKVESAWAYAEAFPEEMAEDDRTFDAQHRAIARAIDEEDGEGAAAAMARHLTTVLSRYMETGDDEDSNVS